MGARKRLSGKLNKVAGGRFETFVQNMCIKAQILCITIPSGMRVVRTRSGLIPVPLRTPFDVVLARNGKCVFLDLKTTVDPVFAYSQMKEHQVEALSAAERHGIRAGYLINLNQNEGPRVAFYDSRKLMDLKPRQSLKYEDGLQLGDPYHMDLNRLFEGD